VINSNLGPIFHRFRDTATYSLKLSTEIAAKPLQTKTWLLLTAYIESCHCHIRWYHRRSYTTYRLATIFSHNTALLAYHVRYNLSRSSDVNDSLRDWKSDAGHRT